MTLLTFAHHHHRHQQQQPDHTHTVHGKNKQTDRRRHYCRIIATHTHTHSEKARGWERRPTKLRLSVCPSVPLLPSRVLYGHQFSHFSVSCSLSITPPISYTTFILDTNTHATKLYDRQL